MWTMLLPIDLPSANRHGGAATNARHAANAAMYRRQRSVWVTAIVATASNVGLPRYPHTIYPNVATVCPSAAAAQRDEAVAMGVGFRHVAIARLWAKGCRAWDDDNLVAACKGLRDAMQRERVSMRKGKVPRLIAGAGIVWDDSAAWSRWTYRQERSHDGRAGVLITVTDEERSNER